MPLGRTRTQPSLVYTFTPSVVSTLPAAYALHKAKVTCPDAKKAAVLAAFAKAHAAGKVDTTDGVKVYTSEGWVLVRPSGTEPIVRVYAEAKTAEAASALAEKSLKEIQALVNA